MAHMIGRVVVGCDADAAFVAVARQRLVGLAHGALKTRTMRRPIKAPANRRGGGCSDHNLRAPLAAGCGWASNVRLRQAARSEFATRGRPRSPHAIAGWAHRCVWLSVAAP